MVSFHNNFLSRKSSLLFQAISSCISKLNFHPFESQPMCQFCHREGPNVRDGYCDMCLPRHACQECHSVGSDVRDGYCDGCRPTHDMQMPGEGMNPGTM